MALNLNIPRLDVLCEQRLCTGRLAVLRLQLGESDTATVCLECAVACTTWLRKVDGEQIERTVAAQASQIDDDCAALFEQRP